MSKGGVHKKEEAGYVHVGGRVEQKPEQASGIFCCKTCEYFQIENSAKHGKCTVVEGEIYGGDCCNYWEPKDSIRAAYSFTILK
jgi:hypothetical protein